MHRDCDRCGVFGQCDAEGICADCRYEEGLMNEDEQDGEETLGQVKKAQSEASPPYSSSR